MEISVLPRRNTEEVIDFSTHLVIAAPPQKSVLFCINFKNR